MLPALAILAFAPTAFVAAAPAAECSVLQLVYARATGEPAASANNWSKGYGAAGYGLYLNLTKPESPAYVQSTDGYPVNYPAGMGTQGQGTTDIISHITKQMSSCPQQKYALGGHSQGGFAVVDAVPKMSAAMLQKVVAITMFGSPACPNAVRDRCISYCNAGDSVCSSRGGGKAPGLSGSESSSSGGGEASAPKAPKMGGAPKGGAPKGSPKGTSPPKTEEASEHAGMEGMEGMDMVEMAKRYTDAIAEAGAMKGCPESLGLDIKNVGTGGHMTYNKDGTYVRAAACYIKAMFQKSK